MILIVSQSVRDLVKCCLSVQSLNYLPLLSFLSHHRDLPPRHSGGDQHAVQRPSTWHHLHSVHSWLHHQLWPALCPAARGHHLRMPGNTPLYHLWPLTSHIWSDRNKFVLGNYSMWVMQKRIEYTLVLNNCFCCNTYFSCAFDIFLWKTFVQWDYCFINCRSS